MLRPRAFLFSAYSPLPVVLMAIWSLSTCMAQDTSWISGGGSFLSGSNWSAGVPNSTTNANFNRDNSGTVVLQGGNADVRDLIVRSADNSLGVALYDDADVMLDLGGGILNAVNRVQIGVRSHTASALNGELSLQNGLLSTPELGIGLDDPVIGGPTGRVHVGVGGRIDAANSIHVAKGLLNIHGGTLTTSQLLLDSGTELAFSSGELTAGTISKTTMSLGALNWTGGTLRLTNSDVTLEDGSVGRLFGSAVTIGTGKTLIVDQDIEIGLFGSLTVDGGAVSAHTIDGSGPLASLSLVSGTLTANSIVNRSVDWTAGTLNLTGSDLTLGFGHSSPIGSNPTLGTGKTLNITNSVTVAAFGSLTVSGGQLNSSQTLHLNGGEFSQAASGGVTTLGGDFLIDNSVATIAGGNVNVNGRVKIGESNGSSTLNHSGGTITASNHVVVGSSLPGVYNNTGGHLTTTGTGELIVGDASGWSGTVNQNGGVVNVQSLTLANTPGADATYNLQSGTLNTRDRVLVGWMDAATYTQDGGEVNTGFQFWVDNGSQATVNEGTINATDSIRVGVTAGTTSSMIQNGGLVKTDEYFVIGSNGSGTYELTGGTIEAKGVNRGLAVGSTGASVSASMTQSGGHVDVGELVVGHTSPHVSRGRAICGFEVVSGDWRRAY